MNVIVSSLAVYRCQHCLRQFRATKTGFEVFEQRKFCIPEVFQCGQEDCAAVAAANVARDDAKAADRRVRRGNFSKPATQRASCTAVPAAAPVKSSPRLPYRDTDPEGESKLGPDVVTANNFSQADFKAEGAADSQNAKLIEFFKKPHNFGLWFKGTFLEEISGAHRMNNRAVDLREYFTAGGLYLDNCMIRDEHTDARSSHYRLCRIEDAVSLNAEQKQKLLASLPT